MRKRFMLFVFATAALNSFRDVDITTRAALAFRLAEAMLKEWELNR